MEENVPFVVGQKHGDGMVLLDDTEEEFEVVGRHIRTVRVLVDVGDLLGRVGPYLHSFTFLRGQVRHQAVGHKHEPHHHRDGEDEE